MDANTHVFGLISGNFRYAYVHTCTIHRDGQDAIEMTSIMELWIQTMA